METANIGGLIDVLINHSNVIKLNLSELFFTTATAIFAGCLRYDFAV